MTEIILMSRGKKQNKQTKIRQKQKKTKKERTKKGEGKTIASLAEAETSKAEFIDTLEHFPLLKCSFKTMILNPLIITLLFKVIISIKGSKVEKKKFWARSKSFCLLCRNHTK